MHLVLMPGMHGTCELFTEFQLAWSAHGPCSCIAYPVDEPLDYGQIVELVRRELPTGPFVLVAESFSGPAAIEVARAGPPGLVGLVLVATFVKAPVSRWMSSLGVLAGLLPFAVAPPTPLIRRTLLEPSSSAAIVKATQHAIRRVSPSVMATRLRSVHNVNASSGLRDCPVPVLYMSASRDRLVSRAAGIDKVKACNPSVEHVAVPSPHLVLQCEPSLAVNAIDVFTTKLR
jgi:pimeloyl-[acyl-carrier protein] methyl ester esterase